MIRRLLVILALIALPLVITPHISAQGAPKDQSTIGEAKILDVTQVSEKDKQGSEMTVKKVTVVGTSGKLQGKKMVIEDQILQTPYQIEYKKGDSVMVSYGVDPTSGRESAYIIDYTRKPALLGLFLLFFAAVVLVGKRQGVFSLIGLIVSFVVIGSFMVPSILLGNDPLVISLFGALFIIPITFYLAHGFNKKTTVAIVGTFITLLLTAVLSYIFVELAKLTGYASEEAIYLQTNQGDAINVKSLLLAGFIIGALAVLNDITISQASVVKELSEANTKLRFKELYTKAMGVGRDHVASLVNTLVLVYAGASLPLFLLFNNTKLSYDMVANQEIIATEIVRTLVTSIGIIAAVPITTALACMFLRKK